MARLALYLVLAIFALSCITWLGNRFVYPIKRLELLALSAIDSRGSGFDDAAQQYFLYHRDRLAHEILSILASARPGSAAEAAALTFVEFVLDVPGITVALEKVANEHPDRETADLAFFILNCELEQVEISQSRDASVHVVNAVGPDRCNDR